MRSFIHTSILLFISHIIVAQSDFIHVDQFGYLPNSEKVAVLSNPINGFNSNLTYTAPVALEVRDANTSSVVFTGATTVWDNGNTHNDSGDQGWWFDFSSLTTPGTYYINDPTNNETSATFEIGQAIYDSVLKDAGRAFFYNRCNAEKAAPYAEANWTDGMNFMNPLQDANCRYYLEPNNITLERELSGGWFDAGDNNKYVTFAEGAVHDLLWAYQESPNAFGDDWNIPESGNGIADIIDEIKWEVDWIKKMVNADGSVIIKMGNIDYADNDSAPPSANTDQRFYGNTCTSASIATAGMLAHAAKVFQQIPALSGEIADLQTKAIATFNYYENALNNNALELTCDDGTIKSGDADREETLQKESALVAAIHLFDLTGDADYNTYIINHIDDAEPFQDDFWGVYKMALNSALLYYTTLPGKNNSISDKIMNSINADVSNNWNGYYGFDNSDLYRAFMPEWSYHWGSNLAKAHYGNLNNLLLKYNINNANAADYEMKVREVVHYFHGVNPLDMVMLSNMNSRGAEKSVNEIYHFWFDDGTDWDNALTSLYGPAPGYVTGGPNQNYNVTTVSPPYNQPIMKSYLDFNTGFPQNSWEISEPAIYYQAGYVRLLASQVNSMVLPVVFMSPLQAIPQPDKVELQWRVSVEENADYYEVQYQETNGDWKEIGRVKASGKTTYRFFHESPRLGHNYYRLKQVDLDNDYVYSDIATAKYADRYQEIKFFPNPLTNHQLTIQNLPAQHHLSIKDVFGKIVYQIDIIHADLVIDIAKQPTGTYIAELSNASNQVVWTEKLVKQ